MTSEEKKIYFSEIKKFLERQKIKENKNHLNKLIRKIKKSHTK
jgi:hypothetical protein